MKACTDLLVALTVRLISPIIFQGEKMGPTGHGIDLEQADLGTVPQDILSKRNRNCKKR